MADLDGGNLARARRQIVRKRRRENVAGVVVNDLNPRVVDNVVVLLAEITGDLLRDERFDLADDDADRAAPLPRPD